MLSIPSFGVKQVAGGVLIQSSYSPSSVAFVSDGKVGAKGVMGASGSSLLNGTTDPLSSLGNNGDSYINTTTYTLFTKASGVWTNRGSFLGASGADGTSLLNGTTDPLSSLGMDGDSYINTTTYTLFTKASGTWTNQGSFAGGGTGSTVANLTVTNSLVTTSTASSQINNAVFTG